ncbi:hypothetical protein BS78_05G017600 [Paspalum vaginatum]|nr:hypothetical protein BS78_05G017600 [Paspalum vaginatum]KAJ1273866.1 hypothetical protein BS78_05G017600 [Paspalum vaginatum]
MMSMAWRRRHPFPVGGATPRGGGLPEAATTTQLHMISRVEEHEYSHLPDTSSFFNFYFFYRNSCNLYSMI